MRRILISILVAALAATLLGLPVPAVALSVPELQPTETRLLADDAAAHDQFGTAVAVSGAVAVVGSPRDDHYEGAVPGLKQDAGSAYVFLRHSDGAWRQLRKITAADAMPGDRFGQSVGLDGDVLVVGAYADDHDKERPNAGSAYVFYRNAGGADRWGQVAKLVGSDTIRYDEFGKSVAVSGDTIVVGATNQDHGEARLWEAGAAYVFSRDAGGRDQWGQIGKLTAFDAAQKDLFGAAVAADRDTVVVTARKDNTGLYSTGSAYVFSRHHGGVDNWGNTAKLVPRDGEGGDEFGWSVAISGGTIAVGAHLDPVGTTTYERKVGSVYVFDRSGDGWELVAHLRASDAHYGHEFGSAVATSGTAVVAGARRSGWPATVTGAAYLCDSTYAGPAQWGEVARLAPTDGADAREPNFGVSLDLDGSTLVVGADEHTWSGLFKAGAAYVIELAPYPGLGPFRYLSSFIAQQYHDFLGRAPDGPGLEHWAGLIATGRTSGAGLIEAFLDSNEFGRVIAPVARLYFAYFLRVPDYDGLMYWVGRSRQGTPITTVSQAFAASAEFQARYGTLTHRQFVAQVYRNVLGRPADPAGLDYWSSQLTNGAVTRGEVMVGFSESAEYRRLIGAEVDVTMTYIGMLRRAPDPAGFTYWVAAVEGGRSIRQLIAGFLGSAEYAARFSA